MPEWLIWFLILSWGGPLGLGVLLAGLGVFYETLNLLFPVWDWTTLADLPVAVRTAIMMAVGYIVLIHPLFVVLRLIERSRSSTG